ncbi:MAG: iron ABC transporter permease [Pseudonocardiales bacterium]|jgi:iron complex transport system permease protein|nr:iron ABC transporter permease [Pseudonocardiales bacterium]
MTAVHTPPAPAPSRLRARRVGLVLALAVLLAAAVLASLAIGAREIPLPEVWSAILGPTGTENDIVVRSLRAPRTLLGVAVGVALGMAGALMQGHTRNPLAEPGLLGVSAGAAFLVVLGIYAFGVTSLQGYVWFAFAGAFGASVLVFLLGSVSRDGATPVTLALAGVAVSALLGALTSAMVLLDSQTLDQYRFWAVGSLAGRDADVAAQVAPFLVAGVLLALLNAPGLNLLSLGEDVARGLGVHLTATRWTGLAAITLLTGAATAACGPIAFVGLVVPHICRALTGPDHRWLVPASGLAGAVLLLAADVVGRVVVRPGELQVGIVLALVGAPFFVLLVRRRRLVSL